MNEDHPKADAFVEGVQKALENFKSTVVGAPQEKGHKSDAEEFVREVQQVIGNVWAE